MDDIVEDTCAIFTRTFEMMKAGVRENLAEAGVDLTSVNLDSVFSNLTDPFDGLKSKHFQEKYFVQNLGLIVSSVVQHDDTKTSVHVLVLLI